jgi:hypothetical protein
MTDRKLEAGPMVFKHRKRVGTNRSVGGDQKKCEVPGCGGSSTWSCSVLDHGIGGYCTKHRDEFLAVVRDALGDGTAATA